MLALGFLIGPLTNESEFTANYPVLTLLGCEDVDLEPR